jgi:serine/threonine-protein kinase
MKDNLSMIFVADVEGQLPNHISNSYKKYAHFREINSGGKANLVACKDTNLGRTVILKKLRPEFIEDRDELRRLIREARITAQLQHPATAPLYELGQDDDGNWFFAMKLIDGRTLFEIIVGLYNRDTEIEKHFTLSRLLNIFVLVADAVCYAHARGVIHRDLKPENIIVGMFGEVTLIDWGAAKVWGMPNDGDEKTKNQRGGTPLYMSPEQVLGHKPVDERTDVFSMGIVLYEMMAQREPFRGQDIQQTFDNIINKKPTPPSEVAPHRIIPPKIEEICLKAIEKDPADRYQSMQDMVNEINQFLSDAIERSGT